MKKAVIVGSFVIVGIIISGCATNQAYLSNISLGMNKQQVLAVEGAPSSISAKGQTEYLVYKQCSGFRGLVTGRCRGVEEDYYVRLINNKVDSYGKVGDFDSVQASRSTIDLNIKNR